MALTEAQENERLRMLCEEKNAEIRVLRGALRRVAEHGWWHVADVRAYAESVLADGGEGGT